MTDHDIAAKFCAEQGWTLISVEDNVMRYEDEIGTSMSMEMSRVPNLPGPVERGSTTLPLTAGGE